MDRSISAIATVKLRTAIDAFLAACASVRSSAFFDIGREACKPGIGQSQPFAFRKLRAIAARKGRDDFAAGGAKAVEVDIGRLPDRCGQFRREAGQVCRLFNLGPEGIHPAGRLGKVQQRVFRRCGAVRNRLGDGAAVFAGLDHRVPGQVVDRDQIVDGRVFADDIARDHVRLFVDRVREFDHRRAPARPALFSHPPSRGVGGRAPCPGRRRCTACVPPQAVGIVPLHRRPAWRGCPQAPTGSRRRSLRAERRSACVPRRRRWLRHRPGPPRRRRWWYSIPLRMSCLAARIACSICTAASTPIGFLFAFVSRLGGKGEDRHQQDHQKTGDRGKKRAYGMKASHESALAMIRNGQLGTLLVIKWFKKAKTGTSSQSSLQAPP